MPKVNAVFVGPPRSGSTWFRECLDEHPEVFVHEGPYAKYFNNNFERGKSWYEGIFSRAEKGQIVVDVCPDYFRDLKVPSRIKSYSKNIKVIMCLRNPIDRAFSHYWNMKRKGKINLPLSKAMNDARFKFDIIGLSLYSKMVKEYFKFFDKEQILILFFEDLQSPKKFFYKVCDFLDVKLYVPKLVKVKINKAGHITNMPLRLLTKLARLMRRLRLVGLIRFFKRAGVDSMLYWLLSSRKEYEKGIAKSDKEMLLNKFRLDIEELEKLTGRKLSSWLS